MLTSRRLVVPAFVLAACGGSSSGSGSSGSDDSGTSSSDSAAPTEGGPSTTEGATADASTTSSSSSPGDSGDETGHLPPPACADEIEPPARPSGAALALQTWGPRSRIGSLAIDQAGVRVIGGTWAGTFTLGGQDFATIGDDEDAFVAVLEPDGSLRWFVPFTGVDPADVLAAIGTTGDVVVVGNFDSELIVEGTPIEPAPIRGSRAVFFAKLDGATGALDWAYTMTNAVANSGHPRRIIATDDGGMVAAASAGVGTWTFQGEEVIEAMAAAEYLVHLDGDGAIVWQTGIFGVEDTIVDVRGIELDGDTTVVPMRADALRGTANVFLDPEVYGSGYAHTTLVARYGPTGAVEDVYAPQADISIDSFALGPCGDMVFGGTHWSALDLGTGTIDGVGGFLARRTEDGELRWVIALEGEQSTASGVIFDGAGQTTWQTFDGEHQAIVRLDSAGEQLWELGYPAVWNYALEDGLAGDGLTRIAIGSAYYDALSVPGLPPAPSDGENHAYLLDIAP